MTRGQCRCEIQTSSTLRPPSLAAGGQQHPSAHRTSSTDLSGGPRKTRGNTPAGFSIFDIF